MSQNRMFTRNFLSCDVDKEFKKNYVLCDSQFNPSEQIHDTCWFQWVV